mmetsp:Transcript_29154/g.82201  ORF Transcript_29154/g.82201 Transcript_29154/m.82201 type:complete len:223 (+) Transcript_29154:216-884(+)
MEVLKELRSSEFNQATEEALKSHRYFQDAEAGTLSKPQLAALVQEQYSIQKADLKSLTHLSERCKAEGREAGAKLFSMLAQGEELASGLLMDMAAWLGLSQEDLDCYLCSMEAQAYPSYLARCAHYGTPAMVAAACAVNFPCWGAQCGRIKDALISGKGFDPCTEKDVAFLTFFATPIDGFDQLAAKCIEEEGSNFSAVKEAVRLLQACELMFWDSIYKTGL